VAYLHTTAMFHPRRTSATTLIGLFECSSGDLTVLFPAFNWDTRQGLAQRRPKSTLVEDLRGGYGGVVRIASGCVDVDG
jgi:hypothetical protein